MRFEKGKGKNNINMKHKPPRACCSCLLCFGNTQSTSRAAPLSECSRLFYLCRTAPRAPFLSRDTIPAFSRQSVFVCQCSRIPHYSRAAQGLPPAAFLYPFRTLCALFVAVNIPLLAITPLHGRMIFGGGLSAFPAFAGFPAITSRAHAT